MNDPLLHLLDGLPPGHLDAGRADRMRVRCHAALAARRHPMPQGDRDTLESVNDRTGPTRFWTPTLAGLGGLYLAETLRQVLDAYGLL